MESVLIFCLNFLIIFSENKDVENCTKKEKLMLNLRLNYNSQPVVLNLYFYIKIFRKFEQNFAFLFTYLNEMAKLINNQTNLTNSFIYLPLNVPCTVHTRSS